MRIVFEAHGEVLLNRKLLRLEGRIRDATPAFEHMADQLRDMGTELFASEGASAGRLWPPLKEHTIEAKLRRRLPADILVASGALRDSLTREGAPDQQVVITRSSLSFGSTVPYARFHQRGTERMPQRRPLDLAEANRKALVRTLQRHILAGELPKR